MINNAKVQNYKSLANINVQLEPLTVFIGPNGSGKSSLCEALELLSIASTHGLNGVTKSKNSTGEVILRLVLQSFSVVGNNPNHPLRLFLAGRPPTTLFSKSLMNKTIDFSYTGTVRPTSVYNFVPTSISTPINTDISASGSGIANSLAKILFDDRDRFNELEERFIGLVSNISRIKLNQDANKNNLLYLVDNGKYEVPAKNISDGTLRILAFLTALYDVSKPGLICFEEPENGIHPWLLNKLMELLQQVSKDGIDGTPTQIIITTHSPVLLNYTNPEQIRAVELNNNGETIISSLPTDSKRFQAALDAYDGELGELWFTNTFGGNPI